MRNWRAFTWVLIAFNVLMLVWLISGLAAPGGCEGLVGDELAACQAGEAIGTGIGVGLIVTVWIVVGFMLGVIWLITGRNARKCPACGHRVKKGEVVCKKCGHDFRLAAGGATPVQR